MKNTEVPKENGESGSVTQPNDKNVSLDICSLREKSKNLDLPLISALCNDKSLLKQTNTIDAGKEEQIEWYNEGETAGGKAKPKFSVVAVGSTNGEDKVDGVVKLNSQKAVAATSVLESTKKTRNSRDSSTSRLDIRKKSDSVSITHRLGFSLSDTKIFDKSKYSICDSQAKLLLEKDMSTPPKQTGSETVVVSSTAKIKSISKQVNAKLAKSSTSANKLKYPVSQPINSKGVKGNSLNENKDKIKFKSLKIKSNNTNAQHSGTSNCSFKS